MNEKTVLQVIIYFAGGIFRLKLKTVDYKSKELLTRT